MGSTGSHYTIEEVIEETGAERSLVRELEEYGVIKGDKRDGDTWYRLRVGRYPTSEQATDTMRKLRDVEGITHVFVATE